MAKVFISYSSRDRRSAEAIATKLRELGHDLWLDEWIIKVGEPITNKIEDGIDDADYLVVLLSRAAVESAWVQNEWRAKYLSELGDGKTSVLPVLLEECQIPALLRDKKYADMRISQFKGMFDLANAMTPTVKSWITPSNSDKLDEVQEIGRLIDLAHDQNTPLSATITQCLAFSIRSGHSALAKYCRRQIEGAREASDRIDELDDDDSFRLVDCYLSRGGEVNPSWIGFSGKDRAREFERVMQSSPQEFVPFKLFLSFPVGEIEALEPAGQESIAHTTKLPRRFFNKDAPDDAAPMLAYLPHNIRELLLKGMRSKLIQHLTDLLPRID